MCLWCIVKPSPTVVSQTFVLGRCVPGAMSARTSHPLLYWGLMPLQYVVIGRVARRETQISTRSSLLSFACKCFRIGTHWSEIHRSGRHRIRDENKGTHRPRSNVRGHNVMASCLCTTTGLSVRQYLSSRRQSFSSHQRIKAFVHNFR